MNQYLTEKAQIAQGFLPVNMQTGANTGDWVSLKEYFRLGVVFFKAPGTAGDDPIITLLQAKTVAGGSSKALTIPRVDKKQAASDLTAVGQFTTSTPAAPAMNDTFSTNTWTNSDLAEQAAIVVIDVRAEDLDIDNGFCCVQVSIADIGTHTELGCALYILHDPRDASSALPSAIVD